VAKWAYSTEAARQPDWCAWLQSVDWTGTGKTVLVASDDTVIWDGGQAPPRNALPPGTQIAGGNGHLHAFRYGPPVTGDMDVILFKPFPVDTVVSAPVSAAGAAWQLNTFTPGHYYGAWRVATGGEPSTVTLLTADNARVAVHLSRWR